MDHVPDALLYKSTALESPPAVNVMRRQQHAEQFKNIKPNSRPSKQNRKSGITSCVTPCEDGHVPNRYGCDRCARHTELSSGPCARCTIVQVNSIGECAVCRDPYYQVASCCGRYTSNKKPKYSRTSTLTSALQNKTAKRESPVQPPAKMATFSTDVATRELRPVLS